MPGALRISFGFYNSRDDIDAAISALWNIHKGKWRGDYHQDMSSGEFSPSETKASPAGWFNL